MDRIHVPVKAYILTLLPQSVGGNAAASRGSRRGQRIRALANGLAVPSFWSRGEIIQAFDEANRIWIREADIDFSPVDISERAELVPADEQAMWIYFLNHLSPQGRAIGVGFVYDLPSQEGGWGGGHIAVISGRKARAGLPGFAGNLLAHTSFAHRVVPASLLPVDHTTRYCIATGTEYEKIPLMTGAQGSTNYG